MSNPNTTVSRYSEEDLAIFKEKVVSKLAEAKDYLQSIQEQIDNINDSISGDGDWMDDTGSLGDLEMLQIMLRRQQNFIVDLENALLRIHNKSYGICVVTGELIEKKRLLAVPTTTKSVAAKNTAPPPVTPAAKRSSSASAINNDDDDEETEKKPAPVRERKEPVIITKVIRKVNPNAPADATRKLDDDDDDDVFDDDFLDLDIDDADDDDDGADDDFDTNSKIKYVDPDTLDEQEDDEGIDY
ncbi:MAG: hypothetical protein R2795_25730 [Saprospiraceae bacterium]